MCNCNCCNKFQLVTDYSLEYEEVIKQIKCTCGENTPFDFKNDAPINSGENILFECASCGKSLIFKFTVEEVTNA